MNMWQLEARDIRSFLERHGYDSTQESDHIIVKDPVYQCVPGQVMLKKHAYQDVMIRDWPAAMKFVSERD